MQEACSAILEIFVLMILFYRQTFYLKARQEASLIKKLTVIKLTYMLCYDFNINIFEVKLQQ